MILNEWPEAFDANAAVSLVFAKNQHEVLLPVSLSHTRFYRTATPVGTLFLGEISASKSTIFPSLLK